MIWLFVSGLATIMLLAACSKPAGERRGVKVAGEPFGTMPDGRGITMYTFTNANGLEVRAIDYGGIVVSLRVPDREGNMGDIALGYDSLDAYLEGAPYFGAIIGRYGNRIGGARFTLDGTTYELVANNGLNHLHGGLKGFDKVVWEGAPFETEEGSGVVFTYTSPDGEEGYPGTLLATVTYTLTDDDELVFDYRATTDEATPVNLTQHTYFNLAGHDRGDILDHVLMINAEAFTPVDSSLIPTGEIRLVEGTPFDFREPTAIGARINRDNRQLRYGRGYDHNFVIDRESAGSDSLLLAARVSEPTSGRVMEIYTTEPGVQFYSGNFLDGSLVGKGGMAYERRTGFCLETQHYPDSPNKPDFPSTILRPGEEYRSQTVYAFSVEGG